MRKHHPELWERLRDLDKKAYAQFGDSPLGKFKEDWSVEQLERRFALEDSQLTIFDYLEEHRNDKKGNITVYRPPPMCMNERGESYLIQEKNIYKIKKYEVVFIDTQTALFTREKIKRATVPDGYYVYELMHNQSDEPYPKLLAKRVYQNYFGSVLLNRPIQLNVYGWKIVEGQFFQYTNHPKMDAHSYLAQYPSTKEIPLQFYILDKLAPELFTLPNKNQERYQQYRGVVSGKLDLDGVISLFWRRGETKQERAYLEDCHRVLTWLRIDGPLENLYKMAYFCNHYGKYAQLLGETVPSYGFGIESKQYKYFLRCMPTRGKENFELYGYRKNTTIEVC